MSITGSLVVFVCLWWIIFFAILPIDVNREKKENIEGVDPGAPENPKILKIASRTKKKRILSYASDVDHR